MVDKLPISFKRGITNYKQGTVKGGPKKKWMVMTSLYDGVDFGQDKGQNSSNLNPSKIGMFHTSKKLWPFVFQNKKLLQAVYNYYNKKRSPI